MLLFQQPTQIPYSDTAEKVLNITPEGATGYGFALVTLIVLAWVMWQQKKHAEKKASEAEAKNDQQAAKVLEFGMALSRQMAAVQQRLEDTRNGSALTADIKQLTEDTNRKISQLIELVKSYQQ